MLDMVKQETERIESRFLEPACGDGNFLTQVLHRKLAVVKQRYGKSLHEYERYAFVAIASLYGVEILSDNAQACRDRLYAQFEKAYLAICKKSPTPNYLDAIRYVLDCNITCGNALSMKCVDDAQQDTEKPIIFSEWSLVTGDEVKRRDFRLDEMVGDDADAVGQTSLFNLDMSVHSEWMLDPETNTYIPGPIKEYPLTSLYEVQHA